MSRFKYSQCVNLNEPRAIMRSYMRIEWTEEYDEFKNKKRVR